MPVVLGAEHYTVCFLSLPGRPGLLPSLAGDSVSSRRIVPASSQPNSRPASVCLPVRLLCCPRAAADTRSFQAILPHAGTTHHSASDDTSFLCLTTAAHSRFTTTTTPHPNIHLRQYNNTQQTNTHPLFTTPACCPYRSLSPAIARPAYRFAHTHSSLCV